MAGRAVRPPCLTMFFFFGRKAHFSLPITPPGESVCLGAPSHCPPWPRNGRVRLSRRLVCRAAAASREPPVSFREGRGSANCCALSRSPQPSRTVGDFHRLPAGSGPKRVSKALAAGPVRRGPHSASQPEHGFGVVETARQRNRTPRLTP